MKRRLVEASWTLTALWLTSKSSKSTTKTVCRSYGSGFEFEYKNFRDRRPTQVRLNKLQIDNQLEDCVFPVVFAPVPPRRTWSSSPFLNRFWKLFSSSARQLQTGQNIMKMSTFVWENVSFAPTCRQLMVCK